MGLICGLEVAGFCRVMVLLVCVQAEVSLGGLSEHKSVAGYVHQYCYRLPYVQASANQFCLKR
jgi:hypothetical protein